MRQHARWIWSALFVAACGGSVSSPPAPGGGDAEASSDAPSGIGQIGSNDAATAPDAPEPADATTDAATASDGTTTVTHDAGASAVHDAAVDVESMPDSTTTFVHDAAADVVISREAGTTVGPDATITNPFDGTTGKPCASDADCQNGAGVNVCSNDYMFTVNGVSVQLWPTPVCLPAIPAGTGNCDPGANGAIQFCDSANPNDATSPGLCVPITTPQTAGFGNGVCLPSCTFTFATDGSAQTGCAGKDTCNNFTFLLDTTTDQAVGLGFCQGTCEVDADCSALGPTWGCQSDIGFCTQSKKTRAKAIGTACTNSGTTSDSATGACNCFSSTGVTAGYCTSACVVGGQACPDGFVCDATEQSTLTFTGAGPGGTNLELPGPPSQNPGLAGTCSQPCALPDAGSPDAGACDVLSTCTAGTIAGPDCQPM